MPETLHENTNSDSLEEIKNIEKKGTYIPPDIDIILDDWFIRPHNGNFYDQPYIIDLGLSSTCID